MADIALAAATSGSGLTNKEQRLKRKAEKQARARDDGAGRHTNRNADQDSANMDEEKQEKQGEEEEEEEEEIEAISHKDLRKRRKLEKQAAKHGSLADVNQDTNAVHQLSSNVASSDPIKPARSPYSLWIGNLSFHTHPDRVQQWLQDNGIEGISRMHMPKGLRKMEYNRGFCYVDVPSVEMVKAGVALSEDHLDGRKLLIKAGSDYSGRPAIDATAHALASRQDSNANDDTLALPKGKTGLTKTAQKILRAQKHPPGPTLFIGNLGFNTTEEGLRELIERSAAVRTEMEDKRAEKRSKGKKGDAIPSKDNEAGSNSVDRSIDDVDIAEEESEEDETVVGKDEATGKPIRSSHLRGAGIRKVRLGQFEDTGKCKGFAFVDFFSPAYATVALIDPHNGFLDGRQLVVQYAGAEAIRRGAPKKRTAQDDISAAGGRRKYDGPRQDREYDGSTPAKVMDGPAPIPGTFDPDAPLPKKHKETKEERMRRREAEQGGASGTRGMRRPKADISENQTREARRAKPGAALANAQRGKVAIDFTAPKGEKKTFD